MRAERGRGDDEEVHRHDVTQVVLQKRAPVLRWLPGPRRPIPPNSGVAHFDPELMEFGLDARRAPGRVRAPHMDDQTPDRGVNAWATFSPSALPAPVGPKSSAVPADDGGRLDEDQSPAPTPRPDAPKPYPEDSIAVLQAHRPLLSLKDQQLLSEGHVLKRQVPLTPERRYESPYRNSDPIPHRQPLSPSRQGTQQSRG